MSTSAAIVVAAVVVVLVVMVNVRDAVADITGTTVRAGDCVCATTGVNARDRAGLSGTIVTTLSAGQCGTIFGGILTKDGYRWYEIKYNSQRMWVAGNYLSISSSTSCGVSIYLAVSILITVQSVFTYLCPFSSPFS
ncbi:spore cortex-lytic enzyme-like [Plakobranchus ocellatus]|uniref:Spore cortex-lytic enzyme-like n=1 Tax=Plakobranchus ocellatus TaxID=259542 RepID=A0AAV4DUW9_9GAST|nr:spore cortex-lytic enzyme-like [Plakobranchus ocellatus]